MTETSVYTIVVLVQDAVKQKNFVDFLSALLYN